MNLVIIRGLPGSGKSTIAEKLSQGKFLVELDDYFMKECQYVFDEKKLKEAHLDMLKVVESYMIGYIPQIFVCDVFSRENQIMPYIKLANEYGYTYQVVDVYGSFNNIHSVPEEILDGMERTWTAFSDFEVWSG